MKVLYKIQLEVFHDREGVQLKVYHDYYKPIYQWTSDSPLVADLVKKKMLNSMYIGNIWYDIRYSDLELYIYYKCLYSREKLPPIEIVTPNNNPYQKRKIK